MKRAHVAAATALVLVSAWLAVRIYRHAHYPKWHATVATGDTEADVKRKMGAADRINVDLGHIWCREGGTVKELLYGHSMPPEWWVVGLDASGKVSCTVHLASP